MRTGGGTVTVHPLADLRHLLEDTTALVCCLPGAPQTAGIISSREIQALPAGRAVIVNLARGSCVDPGAVKAALDSGHLFGFASE